uniref:BioF2-like acetyltransferase domain-containing protein n=1 Tax=Acidianus brierleyi TaxID=41673 RepID=A0A2U9IF94_9CREN
MKLAEKENIHIINEFNFDIYKEYYENCYLQTLESKESTKLQAGYKFFEYLAKKDMLRSVFGLLDNKIISGVFILYDEESRIGYYIDAASSQEGKKLGANYLLLYNQINYFREKGYILDLGGAPLGKLKKWDDIFLFKKKWGKVVDMPLITLKNFLTVILYKFRKF